MVYTIVSRCHLESYWSQLHLTLPLPELYKIGPELVIIALQWRQNERRGVSNHRQIYCLFDRVFRRTLKKTSNLRVTGLCAGNPPVTGGFPTQGASNADFFPIWWRHHVPADGLAYSGAKPSPRTSLTRMALLSKSGPYAPIRENTIMIIISDYNDIFFCQWNGV